MRHLMLISVLFLWNTLGFAHLASNFGNSVATDSVNVKENLPLPKRNTPRPLHDTLPYSSDDVYEHRPAHAPATGRPASRLRHRTSGYRIQVYTGSNNRASKQAALRMKEKVQKVFPELSAYIYFQSPRWICRVGDFISREEAHHYLQKIKKERISPEARIVSVTVLRTP